MKNKLIISVVFCLSSILCLSKTPKKPNMPIKSNEFPRFIRFDNTQEILNWRFQEDRNLLEDTIRHNEEAYKKAAKHIREVTYEIDSCQKWIEYNSSLGILYHMIYPGLQEEINKAKEYKNTLLEYRSFMLLSTIEHYEELYEELYMLSAVPSGRFPSTFATGEIKAVPLKTALENYSKPTAVILRE